MSERSFFSRSFESPLHELKFKQKCWKLLACAESMLRSDGVFAHWLREVWLVQGLVDILSLHTLKGLHAGACSVYWALIV